MLLQSELLYPPGWIIIHREIAQNHIFLHSTILPERHWHTVALDGTTIEFHRYNRRGKHFLISIFRCELLRTAVAFVATDHHSYSVPTAPTNQCATMTPRESISQSDVFLALQIFTLERCISEPCAAVLRAQITAGATWVFMCCSDKCNRMRQKAARCWYQILWVVLSDEILTIRNTAGRVSDARQRTVLRCTILIIISRRKAVMLMEWLKLHPFLD